MFTTTRPQAQLDLARYRHGRQLSSATSDRTLPREGAGPGTWLKTPVRNRPGLPAST